MKKRKRRSKTPRRHHFKPRWYLNGFSICGKQNYCHAMNVASGKPLHSTNVINLGVAKHFFRIADDFAGLEPATADFDNLASQVFSQIILEDALLCNENDFQIVQEFMARMMAFDLVSHNSIITAAKTLWPEDVTKNDDVETVPMQLCYLLEFRGVINNLNYKLLVADKDNCFICPDSVYFTTTRDGQLHFYFPLNKKICLYGCSSNQDFHYPNPLTSSVNTLLFLHSHKFVYFSDWDLKIHNGIDEVPIQSFINTGVDGMLESWISINDHVVHPGKEQVLNFSIYQSHVPVEAEVASHNYIRNLIQKIEGNQ